MAYDTDSQNGQLENGDLKLIGFFFTWWSVVAEVNTIVIH